MPVDGVVILWPFMLIGTAIGEVGTANFQESVIVRAAPFGLQK